MTKSSSNKREPKFQKGNIVYLVSGGPSMSILKAKINTQNDFTGSYQCQWFAGKKLEFGIFPEESLMPTNPKP